MKVVFLLILFIKTEKTKFKVFRNLLRCKDFRRLDDNVDSKNAI